MFQRKKLKLVYEREKEKVIKLWSSGVSGLLFHEMSVIRSYKEGEGKLLREGGGCFGVSVRYVYHLVANPASWNQDQERIQGLFYHCNASLTRPSDGVGMRESDERVEQRISGIL